MRISDWSSDVCSSDLFSVTHDPTLKGADCLRCAGASGGILSRAVACAVRCNSENTGYTALMIDKFLFVLGRFIDNFSATPQVSDSVCVQVIAFRRAIKIAKHPTRNRKQIRREPRR